MGFSKISLAVAVTLGLAQGAAATTFTLTGLGSVPGGGYAATLDGITVTITAPGESLGYLNLDGIGVYTGGINLAALQDGETLLVSFSQAVFVDDLHLRQWEGPDDVVIDPDPGSAFTYTPDNGGAFDTNEHIDLTGLGAITSLTITGDTFLTAALLAGLTVTSAPEPAAGLLLVAVALIAARTRRRA